MANKNYTFGTFPLGYGVKHYCSKCKSEITDENAVKVTDAHNPYLGYGVCSEVNDDEGNNWRTFCNDCFNEVQQLTPKEVYNTYYPGKYEG